MINFYYTNEQLSILPSDEERSLEVIYTVGPHTYTGTIKRPYTELESLRTLVADLQDKLNALSPQDELNSANAVEVV